MGSNITLKSNKAVFLDRDGTINFEKNYLYKTKDFQFIPGVIEAIKIFRNLGYLVIVVTNQSGVARGYYTEKDIKTLHNYVSGKLKEEGTWVDGYYYCPHHPEGTVLAYAVECSCRKPQTGMVTSAMRDFNISLSESIIVGDKEIDVKTGKDVGIGCVVLVRSGHSIDESNTAADMIYDDLYSFARSLVNEDFCFQEQQNMRCND